MPVVSILSCWAGPPIEKMFRPRISPARGRACPRSSADAAREGGHVYLQDREVAVHVLCKQAGPHGRFLVEPDADVVRVLDHVVIRQHESPIVKDETGTLVQLAFDRDHAVSQRREKLRCFAHAATTGGSRAEPVLGRYRCLVPPLRPVIRL